MIAKFILLLYTSYSTDTLRLVRISALWVVVTLDMSTVIDMYKARISVCFASMKYMYESQLDIQ